VSSSRQDPPPELTLSGTGGGRTKWLVAIVALAILGGVVYIGISGQSAAPASTPAAAVAVATESAGPSVTPFPNDQVVSIRANPTAPVLYQYLGTGLTLNGRGTLAVLDPVGPDAYRGTYRIPYPLLASSAELDLDAVTASVSHDDLDYLGHWTFPIISVGQGAGPPIIALDTVGGGTDQALTTSEFQRLATNGFHLTATIQGQADAALMTIDVAINPSAAVPDATYTLVLDPHPPGLAIELESVGNGVYDGELLIPSELVGTTTSLDLLELTSSDVAGTPISVGTWSIRLSKRPRADGRDQ